MICLRDLIDLLSTEKDFAQLFRALLPVFFLQSRSLQAEEFRPGIRMGRGTERRFLTLHTERSLHPPTFPS